MSLWTLLKIVAGLVVLGVVIFTAMLVRHVREEPMGWVFEEIVPVSVEATALVELPEASADLPEIDPGSKVFEKARELIAIGDLNGARDKLRTVVTIYPRSTSAAEARRIVGEMNLDELLSPGNMENKALHEVKRGDSYLGIAGKTGTSLDLIMHMNGLMDLRSLQPGDELLIMKMDLRLLIEPNRRVLSIWRDQAFVAEFPLVAVSGAPAGDLKTKIANKIAVDGDSRYAPASDGYRGASKVLGLERISAVIAALPEGGEGAESELPRGFFLAPGRMEELALLVRPGNEVEIRSSSR